MASLPQRCPDLSWHKLSFRGLGLDCLLTSGLWIEHASSVSSRLAACYFPGDCDDLFYFAKMIYFLWPPLLWRNLAKLSCPFALCPGPFTVSHISEHCPSFPWVMGFLQRKHLWTFWVAELCQPGRQEVCYAHCVSCRHNSRNHPRHRMSPSDASILQSPRAPVSKQCWVKAGRFSKAMDLPFLPLGSPLLCLLHLCLSVWVMLCAPKIFKAN